VADRVEIDFETCIENAQKKSVGSAELRRPQNTCLEYDDVMNKQRETIYAISPLRAGRKKTSAITYWELPKDVAARAWWIRIARASSIRGKWNTAQLLAEVKQPVWGLTRRRWAADPRCAES